jgi:hypothetical protein
MRYWPAASVTARQDRLVLARFAETAAPAMTPPLASRTVPCSAPSGPAADRDITQVERSSVIFLSVEEPMVKWE